MDLDSIAVPVFPPGPESQALLRRREATVGNANYTGLYGVVLQRGDGALVQDVDGNVYLDCLACASSCSLGYGQEFLVEAYARTAREIQQTCFTYSPNVQAIELAERLIEIVPGPWEKRALIGLSGSDSSGGAVKAMRRFTGRLDVIHFRNDYHGSTGLSQQASDYGDLDDGIYSRDEHFLEHPFPTTDEQAGKVLEAIERELATGKVCGIICEAIQGDAGVVVPPPGFIGELRRLTEAHSALLTVDEVQAGMGRTGRWWAFEHDAVEPDLVVIAKGLSSGYAPISAVVGRHDVIDSLHPGQHIFTFGGHPPSAAVASAVIDHIDQNDLPAHAERIGAPLIEALQRIRAEFSEFMLEVRGKGLMIGIQISLEKCKNAGKIFATRCVEKGLYVGFFGVDADVIRIEPPLIIDEACARFIHTTIREVAVEMRDGTIPKQTCENVKKYSIGI